MKCFTTNITFETYFCYVYDTVHIQGKIWVSLQSDTKISLKREHFWILTTWIFWNTNSGFIKHWNLGVKVPISSIFTSVSPKNTLKIALIWVSYTKYLLIRYFWQINMNWLCFFVSFISNGGQKCFNSR